MSKRDTSEVVLREILEAGRNPDARRALVNVANLGELHADDVLAPFVEGFCGWVAKTHSTQRAMDQLRRESNPTYLRLRALLRDVSGVEDLGEEIPNGGQLHLDAVVQGVRVRDIEATLKQWPVTDPATSANSRPCWFVGATWGDGGDQTERFLREGIWENGYTDKLLDLVRQVEPGDRIAIKASFTRKNGLPFDVGGRFVSAMRIKQVGTVVRNHGDGRTLDVEWQGAGPGDDWYHYTLLETIHRVEADKPEHRELIAFAFDGGPQDYERFLSDPQWSEANRPEAGAPDAVRQATLAAAAWPVLVRLALSDPPEVMNYKELGDEIGAIALNVGKVLHPIQEFCREAGLPPITGLVVNALTGLPGEGFTTGYEGWEADVRAYPWGDVEAPTPNALSAYPASATPSKAASTSSRSSRAAEVDKLIADALRDLDNRGEFDPYDDEDARERVARNIAARSGQPEFRRRLLNAYENRCAITGCDVVEVLEAAHIVPHRGDKFNDLRNGLLLRADIHTLMDRGLLSLRVDGDDLAVVLDQSLRGGCYEELHGSIVRPPHHEAFSPDRRAVARH